MYRIPYENEQITKTIAAPYAPVGFTDAEKIQFRENIGAQESGKYSNPNLLMNPFFTINQRNSSGVLSNAYIADRWFTAGGTVNVTHIDGGGIHVTATGGWNINQRIDIPDTDYVGKYVTVSAIVNGSLFSQTVLMDSSKIGTSPIGINTTGNLYIRLDVKSTYASGLYLRLTHMNSSASTDFTLTAVKIEVSSASTLLNDSAPDFATELLKCQRFFYRWKAQTAYAPIGFGIADSATVIKCLLSVPIDMRVHPSVLWNGATYRCDRPGATAIFPTSVACTHSAKNVMQLNFACTGATQGQLYICQAYENSNAYIDFIADL